MQCSKCQTEIPERAKFCPECGAKQTTCASCGAVLPTPSRFCLECGAKQEEQARTPVIAGRGSLTPDGVAEITHTIDRATKTGEFDRAAIMKDTAIIRAVNTPAANEDDFATFIDNANQFLTKLGAPEQVWTGIDIELTEDELERVKEIETKVADGEERFGEEHIDPAVHLRLGSSAFFNHDFLRASAHWEMALAVAEAREDRERMGWAHSQVGDAMKAKGGDPDEVLAHYQQAMAICEELGDRQGLIANLNRIGAIHEDRGDPAQGLEDYERALGIAEEVGDRRQEAKSLCSIGVNYYTHRDESEQAIEYYQRALAIGEELGYRREMATCLNGIGLIHDDDGEPARALEYYERALTAGEELGDKREMSASLSNIGTIYRQRDEPKKAREYYQRALTVDEELGDKRGMATDLNNLGVVSDAAGNPDQALEYYERALVISEELGDQRDISTRLNNIGVIYFYSGELDNANRSLTKCVEIEKAIGDLSEMTVKNIRALATAFYNRGMGFVNKRGDHAAAIPFFEKCLAIESTVGDDTSDTEEILATCRQQGE